MSIVSEKNINDDGNDTNKGNKNQDDTYTETEYILNISFT